MFSLFAHRIVGKIGLLHKKNYTVIVKRKREIKPKKVTLMSFGISIFF
jgi:hypothetical protein